MVIFRHELCLFNQFRFGPVDPVEMELIERLLHQGRNFVGTQVADTPFVGWCTVFSALKFPFSMSIPTFVGFPEWNPLSTMLLTTSTLNR